MFQGGQFLKELLYDAASFVIDFEYFLELLYLLDARRTINLGLIRDVSAGAAEGSLKSQLVFDEADCGSEFGYCSLDGLQVD